MGLGGNEARKAPQILPPGARAVEGPLLQQLGWAAQLTALVVGQPCRTRASAAAVSYSWTSQDAAFAALQSKPGSHSR